LTSVAVSYSTKVDCAIGAKRVNFKPAFKLTHYIEYIVINVGTNLKPQAPAILRIIFISAKSPAVLIGQSTT
jgi:hypothetical protein